MQINDLKRTHKNKKDRIVGRGGKHAKTSGRGGKGQTARAGNKRRPELRDIIKKLPKLRGYSFNTKKRPVVMKYAEAGVDKKGKISFKELRKKLGIKGKKIILK
jgi:ribosomal protein L15